MDSEEEMEENDYAARPSGGPPRGQMIVCTWNVRAPWAPKTEVKKFLNKHKISAVGLLETRVRVNNSAQIQKRFATNKRNMLHDRSGNQITDADAIREEILSFYKGLLGSCADSLPCIDLSLMRKVRTLSNEARSSLCQPVTTEEIESALFRSKVEVFRCD